MDRSLLSKLEHGKNMSTNKLTELIAYYTTFIEDNSKQKISSKKILNEIIKRYDHN